MAGSRRRWMAWAAAWWVASAAAWAQPATPDTVHRQTLGQSPSGRVAHSAQPGVAERFNELKAKALAGEKVRVIVGVGAPFAPEGALGQAVAQVQRSDIARAQTAVERRLPRRDAQARIHRFGTLPFMVMEVDAEQLAALGDMEDVTHLEEDQPRQLLLETSVPFIQADKNWAAGASGTGWAVAVLDDGIQNNHPFLSGGIVSEACYSTHNPGQGLYSLCPDSATSSVAAGSASNCLMPGSSTLWACTHGTHVAGISSGSGADANVAYSGVAKDSSVISVQVFTWIDTARDVSAWDSDILKGLERVYALRNSHNIAAVNLSLGGNAYTDQASCDAQHPSYKAMFDQLRSVGIAAIVASGNDSYINAISVPACISSAVSVGATFNNVNRVATYSNSASFLDLLAPGSSILSSVPSSTYARYSGTSMATPHVAGCWAVLKSAKPDATPLEIENALKATGVVVTDSKSGVATPRIDCMAAQTRLLNIPTVNYTLSVTKAGTGVGTVTSDLGNINCGSQCSASYADGTVVTLAASVPPGNAFGGWSGACSGTGTCTVTMATARSVTASFNAAVLPLNALSLSGAAGSFRNYSFAVPAGARNLRVEMIGGTGSTGDADLYVRFGAAPTLSAYDCRPYLEGNTETCHFATPAAGTHHVMVHAFNAYTKVDLTATYEYTAPTSGCTEPPLILSGTISGTLNQATCAPISTSGVVRLTSTATVTLRSNDSIRFSPGVRVDAGGRLSAAVP